MSKLTILFLLTVSFNLFAKQKIENRHHIYLGLNTTRTFDIVGETAGENYMAQLYSESLGYAIGYQFWILNNLSVFVQSDTERDIDFVALVSDSSTSAYQPTNSLSVSHVTLGANYHSRITKRADIFAGLNYTATDIEDYYVDPSFGIQFGIGANFKRIRTSFTFKRNIIKARHVDGSAVDAWKGDLSYLYLNIGYLL